MTNPPPQFDRLTRTVRGFGQNSTLWLGSDHLFEVRTSGFTERYRRFDLREIQAIYLEPSLRRLWWSLAIGLLAVGVAAIVLEASHSAPAAGIVGGVIAVFILWNLALGPGCRAYLQTGVQVTPLPALVRYPQVRPILARLQPLILAAQADQPPPLPPPVAPIVPAGEPSAAASVVPPGEPPSP